MTTCETSLSVGQIRSRRDRLAPSVPESRVERRVYRLRQWSEDDLECIRLAATNPDIPKGTTVPATFTREAGLAFIRRQWRRAETGEGVSQSIVDLATDRAIGLVWVGLRPQPRVGGLGYWVVPSERGRGAATAAVRMVIPWALGPLALQRLEAWVEPGNRASQQVLRNTGFVQEGRLRNFLTIDGRPSDAFVFSTIPDPALTWHGVRGESSARI